MKAFKRLSRYTWACMTALGISYGAFAQQLGLTQFEGVYQKADNQEAYIRISVRNGVLTGKQLWDDREYELIRQSDTGFVTKAEEYPVRFSVDAKGEVVKATIMNRSEWQKVKDYKPRVVARLSAEQLKALEGKYCFQRDKNLYLAITARDSAVVLKQLWDDKEIVLVPENELVFFSRTQSFPAKFAKDKNGKVTSLTCFEHDIWDKTE